MLALYLQISIVIVVVSFARGICRPEWLSHIDASKLKEFKSLAKQRHNEAVRSSLEQYDVLGPTTLTEEELLREKNIVDNLQLDEFRIKAPGKLPDFHDELGESPVFVTKKETPLFSKDECKNIVEMADNYFDEMDEPTKLASGQYYIQGFWIKDVQPVSDWFIEKCKSRIFPLLKKQFPSFVDDVEDLVIDTAYLFKYTPQPGLRTEIHTDSGCLSFTFSLNPKEEYEGGGTWVEGLSSDDDPNMDEIIEMDVGQCTVRPGGIRHCGNPLTKGSRYIIGGFCMNKKRVENVRQLLTNCPKRDPPERIKTALECAIALNPESEVAYSSLAGVYESLGYNGKAKQVNEDCLLLANPKSCACSYYLGTTYYQEGNYNEALRYIQNCLDIDPADGDALSTMAQCYANMGDEEKEKETYYKIIKAPGCSNRVLGQAYCNLGIMCHGEDMEMTYFEKSLESSPTSLPTLHSIGTAYASRHQWDNSIVVFQQIIEDIVETDEEKHKYLKMLYQVATTKLREEGTAGTQEELMEKLTSAMGKENLGQLMVFQGQAR